MQLPFYRFRNDLNFNVKTLIKNPVRSGFYMGQNMFVLGEQFYVVRYKLHLTQHVIDVLENLLRRRNQKRLCVVRTSAARILLIRPLDID